MISAVLFLILGSESVVITNFRMSRTSPQFVHVTFALVPTAAVWGEYIIRTPLRLRGVCM